jgi:phosphoglycerate dehydrogenase-like enzyme
MASKPKIAITTSRFNPDSPSLDKLKEYDISYTPNQISDKDGVIVGADELFTKQVLDNAPNLKVISRFGVGTDNIDLDETKKRGIKVFTTPEATTDAVAEHTIALILAVTKRIGMPGIKPGARLRGKMIGVIGLGRIGTQVATILSSFGCNIMFYDPFVQVIHPSWYRAEDIDKLLYLSDIVTLHAPGQKKPIVGQHEINTCKNGVIIINTARSSLIDEKSLCAALELGYVSGAGLDVVDRPDLFTRFPQVIITPHVASFTVESRLEMENAAVDNLLAGLKS